MRLTPVDRARFALHDVRGFIVRVYEGAVEANVPFLASGLSFDALLAAIPFVFLLLSVAGYILSAQAGTAQLDIDVYLQQILPSARGDGPNPFAPILVLLARAIEARGTLGLIAVPAFIWFSTRLFGSLRAALNEVFDTRETRSWLMGKVQDILLVLVTTILFVINVLLGQGIELLAARSIGLEFLPFFAAKVLAFASAVVVFVVIFRYAPAHRLRRDTAVFAALICAGGFELAKLLLGLYIRAVMGNHGLVSDATIAAVLLFVVWVYYMSFVFLLGGQIAQVYDLRRRLGQQRLLLN